MKIHLFLAISLLAAAFHSGAQGLPEWEDPQVIGMNKEAYHATLTLPSRKAECGEIRSLNGKWKFQWSKDPLHRPADFYREDFDASDWDDITVPGNWQMQGYGMPIYSNWTYPFVKDAPYVMGQPPKEYFSYENRNPIGSYITEFSIDPSEAGNSVFLHFEGVKSAMYVWVNGRMVGYSENSMSPAEFDITDFVRQGSNKLAVEVYRWSDSSYIEDQDMWRLSGIFRPVELWIRPQTNIRDYTVEAVPSEDFSSASLSGSFIVRNMSDKTAKNLSMVMEVTGPDSYGYEEPVSVSSEAFEILPSGEVEINLETVLNYPRLWSAEKPELYDVKIRLMNRKKVVENFHCRTGVRRVEVQGEVLLVNGRKVKLKGVNRHEHHPRTGRTMDEATLRKDLEMMKQANINMIRTSHYPSMPLFYELCDEYGFYVMSDANNESHDYGIGNRILGNDPIWKKAFLDRAVSLVKRDRNHPSILFWSLGNESIGGDNARAMADTVKAMDPRRIVFYDSDRSVSELYDDSYLAPERMVEVADKVTDKPFMMREYVHAMGNSLGNLQEYWDIIEVRDDIAGAAIWEWNDHGIARKIDGSPLAYGENPSGDLMLHEDEYWAYGGDFGDHPNSGGTLINGLVGADRVPNPHYYQVSKVYQNIGFGPLENGGITLTNKYFFTSLDEFDYRYEWLCDGEKIGERQAALRGDRVLIPYVPKVDGELILNVYAMLRNDEIWAPKGFAVAREQYVVKPRTVAGVASNVAPKVASSVAAPTLEVNDSTLIVKAGSERFAFTTASGALESWISGTQEMLRGPLEPYFWKPANENQKKNRYDRRLGAWKTAAAERTVTGLSASVQNGLAVISFDFTMPLGACCRLTYTADGLGRLQVEMEYRPEVAETLPLIPKVGMRMRIPAEYSQIDWYGRGPWENYPDRKTGCFIGRYGMSLDDFAIDYASPQDNSNRSDVRWFSFSTGSRVTPHVASRASAEDRIKVTGLQELNFRAWPYSEEDLEAAMHPFDLPQRDYINVNIDFRIHGVGGNDGWGARTMDRYTIDPNQPYRFGFILER